MNNLGKKETIQHFLLNLFTILNVEILNLNIGKGKKEKISNLANIASLIIANEDIILDKKPDLFIQEVSLNTIIEITYKILQKRIDANNISIHLPKNDILIKVDKFYFSEALKAIIGKLITDSTEIKFQIDEKNNNLKIIHDKKSNFEKPTNSLSDYLKSKNINKEDFVFHLATEILKFHKIDIKFKNNLLIIQF